MEAMVVDNASTSAAQRVDVLIREQSTEADETESTVAKTDLKFDFDPENVENLIASNAYAKFAPDKEFERYWFQRYRLFTKLDEGIMMDKEGWFSVTPEMIAKHIADRVVLSKCALVIDAFTGVAGNAIQMALNKAFVIAIDLDPIRLRCAMQNAKVYGVEDRIAFICMDFFDFVDLFCEWKEKKSEKSFTVKKIKFRNIQRYAKGAKRSVRMKKKVKKSARTRAKLVDTINLGNVDAVFLSPPWGGPSYRAKKVFELSDLTPDGFRIIDAARRISENIAFYLPKQTSTSQLIAISGVNKCCEIEQSLLNGKVKAITAYYGDLASSKARRKS